MLQIPDWATHVSIHTYEEGGFDQIYYYDANQELPIPDSAVPVVEFQHTLGMATAKAACQVNTDWKAPTPTTGKQERYLDPEGKEDFIDESYRTMEIEDFIAAMHWTIRKYMSRFGKKDDIESESYKIMDYAIRTHEKVVDYCAKHNENHPKIDEVV